MVNKIQNKKELILEIFLIILVLAATIFMSVTLIPPTIINEDQYIIATVAERMLDGERLYTDIFEFYPPSSFLLMKGMFLIFGLSQKTVELTIGLVGTLAILSTFLLTKHFIKSKIKRLVIILFTSTSFFFIWPVANPHWLILIFANLGLLSMIAYLEKQRWFYILASGFCFGLALSTHTSKGLFLVLATVFFLFLLEKRWLPKIVFALTAFLTPLVILTPFFLRSGLNVLFDRLVRFPLTDYPTINFHLDPVIIILLLFTVGAGFWLMRRQKQQDNQKYLKHLLLLTTGIGLITGTAYSFDSIRFFTSAQVVFIWLFMFLEALDIKRPKLVNAILIFFFLIPTFLLVFRLSYKQKIYYQYPRFGKLFYSSDQDGSKFRSINSEVEKFCGQDTFVYFGPYSPSLYFFSHFKNPTPFSILYKNYNNQDHLKIAIDGLNENQVRCAIIVKFDYIESLLGNYLNENWRVMVDNQDMILFRAISSRKF